MFSLALSTLRTNRTCGTRRNANTKKRSDSTTSTPRPNAISGVYLELRGRFAEALVHRQRGHDLGSPRANWRYHSEEWVRECKEFLLLDHLLPAFRKGAAEPKDAKACVKLASICVRHKGLPAMAFRYFMQAFHDRPDLAKNPDYLDEAACAAALAGCGLGDDSSQLSDGQRGQFRAQALAWLRQALIATRVQWGAAEPDARKDARELVKNWQVDPDLRGVRDRDALDKLGEAERQDWLKFWDEVSELLK